MPSPAQLDRKYVWHPFTQMRDWLKREPIVIVAGRGAILRDARGKEYLDANSSIWTNLHGHRNVAIDAALKSQLGKIAHSSALGLANQPASLLAEKLVRLTSPTARRELRKVFFSDDGSTAMEAALKMAYEFARRAGRSIKPKFLSLQSAYHGDTVGAVSLGHIDLFRKAYSGLLFKSDSVAAPFCYRCPFNRAKPERADARLYRKCNWECALQLERKFAAQKKKGDPYAGFVFEPLIQGAAGMVPQPQGWLRRAAEIARAHGSLLIADEVMTGFGRTGPLFACHSESVSPDLMVLAKGMTGGYLPMAATLATQKIFNSFLGRYDQFKTFFHGHSYTANQLGAAASLASLRLLESPSLIRARRQLQRVLARSLPSLWSLPNVGDIRQVGLIAGVELVRNWKTREPFPLRERIGIRVCEAMSRRGVLTRPVGNVIVVMPPFCTTASQARRIVSVLRDSVEEVCGP
ncbi:MAG TPA: adenosylmethionine--8-amino-7-oxononanoate transaminase [Candidatus Baltobacteraceae bacterium]|nr:adenosylmethionine--8-amino-7-oxononanoate transaminase [Candidatus Baltobacteraceae bacterium]